MLVRRLACNGDLPFLARSVLSVAAKARGALSYGPMLAVQKADVGEVGLVRGSGAEQWEATGHDGLGAKLAKHRHSAMRWYPTHLNMDGLRLLLDNPRELPAVYCSIRRLSGGSREAERGFFVEQTGKDEGHPPVVRISDDERLSDG